MIKLNQITKIYNKTENSVPALDGVSLSIMEGEAIAIMGPSGSGKTTLLNIIGCMDEPDQGKYMFDEMEINTLTKSKAALVSKPATETVQRFSPL